MEERERTWVDRVLQTKGPGFTPLTGTMLEAYDRERNSAPVEEVSVGSNDMRYWLCPKCGGSFERAPTHVARGSENGKRPISCPYCLGRAVAAGINDLATLRPDLAEEWDESANSPLSPEMVMTSSRKIVRWICPRCKGSYPAMIKGRVYRGTACPCVTRRGLQVLPEGTESRRVRCIENRYVFSSLGRAAAWAEGSAAGIRKAMRNPQATAYGFHWMAEDEWRIGHGRGKEEA